MHEMTQREDFDLGPLPSASMVADIHTKAFPDSKAEEWGRVRRNANILAPDEIKEAINSPGLGWRNRWETPDYTRVDRDWKMSRSRQWKERLLKKTITQRRLPLKK